MVIFLKNAGLSFFALMDENGGHKYDDLIHHTAYAV